MKKILTVLFALILVFLLTGCSIIGGGSAKPQEDGWEMIQKRKGEDYYEKCEWIHANDLKSLGYAFEKNQFDGNVYYEALKTDGGEYVYDYDYYKYNIKSKELISITYDDYTLAYMMTRGSGEPVVYRGTLPESAEAE